MNSNVRIVTRMKGKTFNSLGVSKLLIVSDSDSFCQALAQMLNCSGHRMKQHVSPSGITLDTLLKSWDLLVHPPYCDWLQRAGQAVLLGSVLYR